MKCRFRKKCEYYDEVSATCNEDQFWGQDKPYCGKYKEFEKGD